MGDLNRYGSQSPSLLSPSGRSLARDLQRTRREATVALAQGDGLAEFTAAAMSNTAALDRHRRLLARGDDFLSNLLAEEEVSFVLAAMSIQRGMYRQY